MSVSVRYLHLAPGAAPAQLDGTPFKALVAVEAAVSPQWQSLVSDWLVRSGCLYMMAWGEDCSSWDDSVDLANIRACGLADIPENQLVMTTWHADETLAEVLCYCKHTALHPAVDLDRVLLLHISPSSQEQRFLQSFAEA